MADRKIITLTERDALKDLVAWFDRWSCDFPFPSDLATPLNLAREALSQNAPAKPSAPEMVERVARAIYEAEGKGNFGWPPEADLPASWQSWEEAADRNKIHRRVLAHAAIEAMREPTETMIAAGVKEFPMACDEALTFTTASELIVQIWNAMIDAARED